MGHFNGKLGISYKNVLKMFYGVPAENSKIQFIWDKFMADCKMNLAGNSFHCIYTTLTTFFFNSKHFVSTTLPCQAMQMFCCDFTTLKNNFEH